MTQQTTPNQRGWQRFIQFRLITMLVLTLLAAIGVNIYRVYWHQRPTFMEFRFPDGMVALRLMPELEGGGSDASEANGPFVVRDRHGRIFCRGWLRQGKAHRRWTFYHASGRTAMRGECRAGSRIATWTAWYANGRPKFEIEHGEPEPNSDLSLETLQSKLTKVDSVVADPVLAAIRHGATRAWWDNGRPRFTGQYANNRPAGMWTRWDQAGQVVAAGKYRDGRRHGPWQLLDSNSGQLHQVFFVQGQRVKDLDKLLAQLAKDANSDDAITVHRALATLAAIGPRGVPRLVELLESGSERRRVRVLLELASLGPAASEALPALKKLADHDKSSLRGHALAAIYAVAPHERIDKMDRLIQLAREAKGRQKQKVIKNVVSLGWPILTHIEVLLQSDESSDRLIGLAVLNTMILNGRDDDTQLSEDLDSRLTRMLEAAQHHEEAETSRLAKIVLKNLNAWEASQSGGLVSIIPVVN